ncbi:MAG: hypothetical protein L3J46_00115 [Kangiellaceae bacterium]|nr:hypothetical protein [Kangiellaceae bacterium]
MKSIRQSMWVMSSHSLFRYIFLVTLLLFSQSYTIVRFIAPRHPTILDEFMVNIDILFSVFSGLYIGNALLILRKGYLWTINPKYRHSLIAAYIANLAIYTLFVSPLIFILIFQAKILIISPLFISIIASMILLGRNLVHQVIVPTAIAGLIIFRGIDDILTTWLLFLGALESAFHLVKASPDYSPKSLSVQQLKTWSSTSDLLAKNFSLYSHINDYVGRIASTRIVKTPKVLDWAILSIHARFAIWSIMWATLIVVFSRNMGQYSQDSFVTQFITFFIFSLIIESRNLFSQTIPFAHLFAESNYRSLKAKIVKVVDKAILINILVTMSFVLIAFSTFDHQADVLKLIFSILLMGFLGLAFNPFILSFGKINKPFVNLMQFTPYLFFSSLTFFYLVPNLDLEVRADFISSINIYIFLAGCVSVRYLGFRFFQSRSIEHLIDNRR